MSGQGGEDDVEGVGAAEARRVDGRSHIRFGFGGHVSSNLFERCEAGQQPDVRRDLRIPDEQALLILKSSIHTQAQSKENFYVEYRCQFSLTYSAMPRAGLYNG